MKQKIAQFMAGRNGNDQFNMFLLVLCFIVIVFGAIFKKVLGSVSTIIVLLLLAYTYFRMFSKNVYKRREENEKFIKFRYTLRSNIKLLKERWNQRGNYKFFKCPMCKTVLRVPKGKGKIKVLCKKCGNSFYGRS